MKKRRLQNKSSKFDLHETLPVIQNINITYLPFILYITSTNNLQMNYLLQRLQCLYKKILLTQL
jgi:hypothetical protein